MTTKAQEKQDFSNLNIFQKMLKATEEIGTVAKNLTVATSQTQSYKAVSERDILDAVKPIETKYGIYSYPVNREILDESIQERETKYGVRKELFMRIKTVYRFINIDNPDEFIETTTYADGIDGGDKATGKAMTYADKYALMKAYKISTGEDPDQEASTNLVGNAEAKATPKQVQLLQKCYYGENLEKLLQANKIEKLEDMPKSKATELIGKLYGKDK